MAEPSHTEIIKDPHFSWGTYLCIYFLSMLEYFVVYGNIIASKCVAWWWSKLLALLLGSCLSACSVTQTGMNNAMSYIVLMVGNPMSGDLLVLPLHP